MPEAGQTAPPAPCAPSPGLLLPLIHSLSPFLGITVNTSQGWVCNSGVEWFPGMYKTQDLRPNTEEGRKEDLQQLVNENLYL